MSLYVEFDIDISYGVNVDVPIVARRNLKFDYYTFSSFRDAILNMLQDTSKFRLNYIEPSTKNEDDKNNYNQLFHSLHAINLNDAEECEKLYKYLKTKHSSNSIYVNFDILNPDGTAINDTTFLFRISDHIDLGFLTSALSGKEKILDKHPDINKDVTIQPVSITLHRAIKQGKDAKRKNKDDYEVDIDDMLKTDYTVTSFNFNEILQSVQTYLDKLYNYYVHSRVSVESSVNLKTTSKNSRDTVKDILYDLTSVINDFKRNHLHSDYFNDFRTYKWRCSSAEIDDEGYIVEVDVKDNKGRTIRIACDIYIQDYFTDIDYYNEIIECFCVSLFESYDFLI